MNTSNLHRDVHREFAQTVYAKLRGMAADALDKPWNEHAERAFVAQVRNMVSDAAYDRGLHPDAGHALAEYLFATVTIETVDGPRLLGSVPT